MCIPYTFSIIVAIRPVGVIGLRQDHHAWNVMKFGSLATLSNAGYHIWPVIEKSGDLNIAHTSEVVWLTVMNCWKVISATDNPQHCATRIM
jgi:hypothetical protein